MSLTIQPEDIILHATKTYARINAAKQINKVNAPKICLQAADEGYINFISEFNHNLPPSHLFLAVIDVLTKITYFFLHFGKCINNSMLLSFFSLQNN